jgi:hypothetical protein
MPLFSPFPNAKETLIRKTGTISLLYRLQSVIN